MLLRDPARIEALFTCQFIDLLICALIEGEAGQGMCRRNTSKIALYLEYRHCTGPSTKHIVEIVQPTSQHHLYRNGTLVETFAPQPTNQHQQILGILGMTPTIYTQQEQRPQIPKYPSADLRKAGYSAVRPQTGSVDRGLEVMDSQPEIDSRSVSGGVG